MRIDEISNHSEQAFYGAVGSRLSELLGVKLALVGVEVKDGRSSSKMRKVLFKGKSSSGEFFLTIRQTWEFDQSPTKPDTSVEVTDASGASNGAIDYGRMAFWSNDPAGYADDLAYNDAIADAINDFFI